MAVTERARLLDRRAAPTGRGNRGGMHGETMIRRWRRTGDEQWRTRAIEAYMPLARKLAGRYGGGREPFDDLVQAAYLGLVKAVNRFDVDAGTRFASFAIPTINGELRRHFRDRTWAVHVPRGVQEDMLLLRDATRELADRLGRSPTVSELERDTGLDPERIVEALHAQVSKDPSSLDSPPPGEADGDSGMALADSLGREDDGFDLVEHRVTIAPLLKALPARERDVLFMRFARDMTQSEIAERVGCSQMQISRILRRALERLSAADRAAEVGSPDRR